MRPVSRSHVSVWRWPVALAVLTLAGLFMALLGNDALWRVGSWTALAVPLAVVGWKLGAARK
ncbi:hypothetical protein [Luteibacter sp. Lutesp34]|uniref:hypothetical protein n=1 Tax=Luteibacter sp. Lutesp34 TaxID=3243030 RepID=UPI0039B53D97